MACTRASSMSWAIVCGSLACAAIAPASTARAALSARSGRAVSTIGTSRRATSSSCSKRSGRRKASARFSSSSSACGVASREARRATRLRQALDVLNRAGEDDAPGLERQSLLAQTHMNLGQVSLIKGRYDEAETAFTEASLPSRASCL